MALKKAGLPPEEVWYIGDQYECDIVGAAGAGLFPVWYIGALQEADTKKREVLTVESWRELEAMLNQKNGYH